MESVNSPSNSCLQGQKMKEKNKSIKTDIHSQETLENSEKKFCECREKICANN